MQYIAIICSTEEEFGAIHTKMGIEIVSSKIHNIQTSIGEIAGMPCILALSGVGKVNSARTVQYIIDNNEVSCVIGAGTADALNPALNIGDVLVSKDCLQFDFDMSFLGHERGFVPKVGKHFASGSALINCARPYEGQTLSKLFGRDEPYSVTAPSVRIGSVATADRVCFDPLEKRKIYKSFLVDCADMASAAIAQTCRLCGVPFVAIRVISDKPKVEGSTAKLAAKNFADFIARYISQLTQDGER